MILNEVFEASPINVNGNQRSREGFDSLGLGTPKHASFCFGRINPPTLGHAELFSVTKQSAIGGDFYIFISKTHDNKDNPLDYETKLQFVNDIFPEYDQHVVVDKDIKNPLLAADWLYEKGIRAMTMVAGSDRLTKFKEMLDKWNSPEIRAKYNREPCYINVVSSGEREDGSEGVEGVSASGARLAAKNGNLKEFQRTTGTTDELSERLYNAVRDGLGLPTELKESAANRKLGDLVMVKKGMQDADFWIEYRGSENTVGTPSKEYGPYKLGIKVVKTGELDPKYLYYVFQHLHMQGAFRKMAHGTTNLVNLRIRDITDIPIA